MCVLPKLSHLAQAVPAELFQEVFAEDLEVMMYRSVALCAGLQGHESLIKKDHVDLASLPYSMGGLNLQCPNRGPLHAPAILGAIARALKGDPEKRLKKLCAFIDVEEIMQSPYIVSLADMVQDCMTEKEKKTAEREAATQRKKMKKPTTTAADENDDAAGPGESNENPDGGEAGDNGDDSSKPTNPRNEVTSVTDNAASSSSSAARGNANSITDVEGDQHVDGGTSDDDDDDNDNEEDNASSSSTANGTGNETGPGGARIKDIRAWLQTLTKPRKDLAEPVWKALRTELIIRAHNVRVNSAATATEKTKARALLVALQENKT